MDLDYTMWLIREKIKMILVTCEHCVPKIAIFPFGQNGMIAKEILNKQFGIEDVYIIDNELCKHNPNIHSLQEYLEQEVNCYVLLTATNILTNKTLEKMLGSSNKVINIMDPVVRFSEEKGAYFKELCDLLKVRKVQDIELVRVGKNGDGGYIMLDDFSSGMKAYSFGISDDMSWDMHIYAKEKMMVYMYDHTITSAPSYCEGCVFNKIGIGVNDGKDLLSMKSILESHNDLDNTNLILKMDVEGAEWDVINSLDKGIISDFKQMLFEFHDVTDISARDKIVRAFTKINETHQVVWIHGNNYSFAEMSNDILIPNALEVLYVRKNDYSFSTEKVELPMELDMPNYKYTKDFVLHDFV